MDTALEETKDTFIKKKRNHILKRIKKHLGIVRRDPGSCSSQNNLPPLQFHNVHGDNIRLSRDGSLAKRFESFCRALTFSSRPVRINERIYLRLSEISNNWNGGIRFGFTNNDPVSLENSLPKYACPDLTNRPGFWAKALHEQYCELDNVLHYYVNSSGEVIYGINGEEKGIILSGIDIHGLLWTIIDIYGNCTAIELLDSRLFNQQNSTQLYISQKVLTNNSSCLIAPLQSLNISDGNMPSIQHCRNVRLMPFQFHTTKGRNVVLSPDRLIASRLDVDFCQGYVFTSRAIKIDEQYVIQVLKTDTSYVGTLAFGLTSCNPDSLNHLDLPTDSNFLLDRPEYWIVSKDIASPCNKGDEISFNLSPTGEISVSKNHGPSSVIMHVDNRLQLWAFFDIYGSTQSLRLFSHPKIRQYNNSLTSVHATITPTDSLNIINSYARQSILHPIQPSTSNASVNIIDATTSPTVLKRLDGSISLPNVGKMLAPASSDINIHPGGTVLVVNLPPSNVSHLHNIDYKEEDARTRRTTTTFMHNLESCKKSPYPENECSSGNVIPKQTSEQNNTEKKIAESECTICYERNIDSVLYMCGHMCMCYDCAIEQWRGVGGGQCPLCRAVIRDVIRTYTT